MGSCALPSCNDDPVGCKTDVIGMLACDLQRSVNILTLLLDALQRTCLGVTLLAVKLMSGEGGSEPPSFGISMLACDLQRSVNILILLLGAM